MDKMKNDFDFCTNCRKTVKYTLQKRKIKKTIKNKEYTFSITCAMCNECGEEMNILGLIDKTFRKLMNNIEHMKILYLMERLKNL